MVSPHAPHPLASMPNRTGCTSQHSSHRTQNHASRRITVATELRERGTRRPSTVSPVLFEPPSRRADRFVLSTSFKSVAFRSEDLERIDPSATLAACLISRSRHSASPRTHRRATMNPKGCYATRLQGTACTTTRVLRTSSRLKASRSFPVKPLNSLETLPLIQARCAHSAVSSRRRARGEHHNPIRVKG
jgi:hypothetical protein